MIRTKMARGLRMGGLAGASAAALLAGLAISQPAMAQDSVARFDVPQQPLGQALLALGRQARISVAVPQNLVAGRTAPTVEGELTTEVALNQLLAGSGLRAEFFAPDVVRIVQEGEGGGPQGTSGAGDAAEVEALIVTAQKKEEQIQDVPIAISAFTQRDLEAQKVEGGFDLLKVIPNVTFSKSNFSSYNFSIRGVGTKAISATTDPGVAVAFNNTTLIQNRLFEQEYFDIERVEVLRGPQGTLYGRNATSGVINVISAKPDLSDFTGSLKAEVGNYNTRR
ncbi:MAG TPA: TonB-dependent receptor, partial [Caulobacteraceae bacterium]|nr:TonB-dependent receptor [Caulobacteraceae bacterium]